MKEMHPGDILIYKMDYNYSHIEGNTLKKKDQSYLAFLQNTYPEHCEILEKEVTEDGFDYPTEVKKMKELLRRSHERKNL